MANYDYDLIVIGAGSGGISSAILGKNLGKRVALVEKNKIGGDCTWYGCVPSKALLKAADIAQHVMHASDYGLRISQDAELDASKVMAHVRSIRESIYKEEKPEVFEKMGIDVYIETPQFVDAHTIQLGERTVTSGSYILATGSSPFVPKIVSLDTIDFLTNETIFDLEVVPRSIVIVGGGPIGTEMASALVRLGVEVTQIEVSDHVLSKEDPELAQILMERMREQGVKLLTNSRAIKVASNGEKTVVTIRSGKGELSEIETDSLLIAVGRRPNIHGLNLEAAGVAYSDKGISVNNKLQTSTANIYALGDVIGSYQFSHVAEYHSGIAVPNALLPIPIKRKVDYKNVVWATFADPELARAGLTEAEARQRYGDSIKVYRFPYNRVDRAKTDLNTTGVSKFVCDSRNRILGIHIIGERATELLHEAQLARVLRAPFHKIQKMIHVYPSYGDMVKRPSVAAFAEKLQNIFIVKLIKKLKK